MIEEKDSDTRRLLMRKIMTICPLCGKKIFGRDIDFSKLNKNSVKNWPVRYTYEHSHLNYPIHKLDLYIDANFAVRDRILVDNVNLPKK
ncbi:MAG: hypothetical protein ACTSQP_03180 [Promethearchaeota archaeon]